MYDLDGELVANLAHLVSLTGVVVGNLWERIQPCPMTGQAVFSLLQRMRHGRESRGFAGWYGLGGRLMADLAHFVSLTGMVVGNLGDSGNPCRVTHQAVIASLQRVRQGGDSR